jgi:hypothetical protein
MKKFVRDLAAPLKFNDDPACSSPEFIFVRGAVGVDVSEIAAHINERIAGFTLRNLASDR